MKPQRHTHQRQLILDAVQARCDHPSADQIYLDVRALDERISRGTVYRNLKILAHHGEVLQVKLPDSDRFEGHAEKHYHLICQGCGAVCDAPLPYDARLDEKAASATGYIIEKHRAFFEGLCPECQMNRSDPH